MQKHIFALGQTEFFVSNNELMMGRLRDLTIGDSHVNATTNLVDGHATVDRIVSVNKHLQIGGEYKMPLNNLYHTADEITEQITASTNAIDLSKFHLGDTVYFEGGNPGEIIRGTIYELRTIKFRRDAPGMSPNGADYIAYITDVQNLTTNRPYMGYIPIKVSLDKLYHSHDAIITMIATKQRKG